MSTFDPKRLIFMACSATKRDPGAGRLVPARELYQGQLWLTLAAARARARAAGLQPPAVIVLSGFYGFIREDELIGMYHQVLTPRIAEGFLSSHIQRDYLARLLNGAELVHVAGGKLYRSTMRRALFEVGFAGLIDQVPRPRGIGDIRVGLRTFVERSPAALP